MSKRTFYANFLIDLGFASLAFAAIVGGILILIAEFPA